MHLQTRRLEIINMAAGGDIDRQVFQTIEQCDTFLSKPLKLSQHMLQQRFERAELLGSDDVRG